MKPRPITTQTPYQLAKTLGLYPAEGAAIRLRSELNSKIIAIGARKITASRKHTRASHWIAKLSDAFGADRTPAIVIEVYYKLK